MADVPIGGALLRLMGAADAQEPTATMADVAMVLQEIMGSEEMRARCSTISALVKDADMIARANIARALAIILVTHFDPREGPPRKKGTGIFLEDQIDYTKFKSTTATYAALCPPLPKTGWVEHIEANRKKSGAAEFANVSPYLFDLLAAIEDLLNIQGHLLKR